MKRSLILPVVALALAACNREAPALPATTTATPATPAVVVRADCPAEAANLPALSLSAAAEDSSHLRIETLPTPVRGRCELEYRSHTNSEQHRFAWEHASIVQDHTVCLHLLNRVPQLEIHAIRALQ